MGYIKHHAIVITSWRKESMEDAAKAASTFNLSFLGPSEEQINGYSTMVILPDGSKEGWSDSDDGDMRRRKMKEWLRSQQLGDGSNYLEWCEMAFGADDKEATVVDSEWR